MVGFTPGKHTMNSKNNIPCMNSYESNIAMNMLTHMLKRPIVTDERIYREIAPNDVK